MRDVLYHACWLFLLPITFFSAHLGVLLWIWVALLPPADVLYGRFGVVLPFNKLVAASTFFVLIASQCKKDFYRDRLITLVILYGIVVTLSYMFAEYASPSADLQYDKFWKEVVLFFLLTGVMFTRHRLHQVALVTSIAFGFIMVKEALIFLLTAGGHQITTLGTYGDNNGLALALADGDPVYTVLREIHGRTLGPDCDVCDRRARHDHGDRNLLARRIHRLNRARPHAAQGQQVQGEGHSSASASWRRCSTPRRQTSISRA